MRAIRNSHKIERQQGTKTRTRRTIPRIWPRLEDQEQSMHLMCTQTRYDSNARDDNHTGSPEENHSFTATNTHADKVSRTSSYKDKVEMLDITRKYKVVNHVDKKTWSGTQISSRRWSSST